MDNEDTAVLNYFKDKKNGFYIDVGCYHPIHRNNTYLLHKKNWSGINVDINEFEWLKDCTLRSQENEKIKILNVITQC